MICGLEQKDLAEKMGLSERQYRRIESGESPLPDNLAQWLKPVLLAHMDHVRSTVHDAL